MPREPHGQPHADRKFIEGPYITIAEDDDDIRSGMANILAQDGYTLSCVTNGEQLVDELEEDRCHRHLPDVLILDHRMPGYCGLEILEGIRELGWTTPVIVVTAFGEEVRGEAQKLGAYAVFDKPFDPDDLRTAVSCLLNTGAERLSSSRAAPSRKATEREGL